jgi:protein-disulfide isomerase
MNIKLIARNLLSNKIFVTSAILIIALLLVIFNSNNNSNNQSSNQDIETVIANWINDNPEAIIASIQNMQKKLMEEQLVKARKSLSEKKDELYNDKNNPVIAEKKSDITIVEFFDYSCGYCKRASNTVAKLIAEDKKIKIIHKHYPILGQPSKEMSQVAIAINISQPKIYQKFHYELMKASGRGKQVALDVAKKVGANVKLIEETLINKKNDIENMIMTNLQLGTSVGVTGTPGFIIGEELIPGAIGIDSFKSKIKAARATK